MKISIIKTLIIFGFSFFLFGCNPITELKYENPDLKVIFLHHSTGNNVWYGDVDVYKRFHLTKKMCEVPRTLKEYNEKNNLKIDLVERAFPSGDPYPWKNYPYDYYNIWVKNAGKKKYMEEETLEMLTKNYDIIIFKHCFPVSDVLEDDSIADVNSEKKTLSNYKLQYEALKRKLYEFPENTFIVWTGAALTESNTKKEKAQRAREFSDWVKNTWDTPDDNIEIFDFRQISTDGGLYLKPEYSYGGGSHPNASLSHKAAGLFAQKIISVSIDLLNKNQN